MYKVPWIVVVSMHITMENAKSCSEPPFDFSEPSHTKECVACGFGVLCTVWSYSR